MSDRALTAIDVCAGAGGWACAARGLPIRIVAAFDREIDALQTYTLNHPGVEAVRCDVATHDFQAWRGVDLILGGIPCEQLSACRRMVKAGPAELRTLRRLVARCLALPNELGARWWCYEDVEGLKKLLPKKTPYLSLCSSGFSAQRRKRIYVGNCPSPEVPANGATLRGKLRAGPYRVGPRLHGLEPRTHNVFQKGVFLPWMPDSKSPTVITLTSRRDADAATPHGIHWRNLEWQELAALQGFPSDYLFFGSPSRVTKMVAQAVQIDTARAILVELCRTAGLMAGPLSTVHSQRPAAP